MLEEWKDSGCSIRTFAAARGLNAQRLYWWRQRLSESGGREAATVALVPVRVREPEAQGGLAVVRLPRGVVLEVDPGFAPEWIAALAVALAGD